MKRTIKTIAKSILLLIGTIICLLFLYVLFNLDLFHRTKPLPAADLRTYAAAIDSKDPLQYVAEKFNTHDVVFLGELHKRQQDLAFFKDLIPYLYQAKGIKMIGWEFGAAEYQQAADSVVTAAEFDRAKAITIMRNSMYSWCFEDYLEVFRTIWQLNSTIPQDSNKVRFLQLNISFKPKSWNSPDDSIRLQTRKINFDNLLPGIIEKEVIARNQKILIYCGLHHSLTRFKTAKLFFAKDTDGRAGQRLYGKYPEKIFQICLLSPFLPRWTLYKEMTGHKQYDYVYPFDAVFNQLYDTIKKPFAVDAANPAFAGLKDYNSFYAFDRFNGIQLREFCDGVIMPAGFDQVQPVVIIPDWVPNTAALEEIKKVLPEEEARQLHSPQELMKYINPDADQEQIRRLHSQQKFW
ncbi:MAG: hypothetical protein P0Y53_21050 [Candidatus Pseudobacter hemicellulosilyticus]|uniref:Haem-binding uptake Tiki superfamily ChaN domain-containing protein n=1 Tax=Candidatus Pseudobacter hemicellulosilyticus TaxID=3121375 RepID=A0AAJ6BGQ5_9BACT|nr:MAG: hypothetical protein P0Y53_21050 [Pseudobacter sp.]